MKLSILGLLLLFASIGLITVLPIWASIDDNNVSQDVPSKTNLTEMPTNASVLGTHAILAHYQTILHATNENWEFINLDFDEDNIDDIIAINKHGDNGRTDIHILKGPSFQSFHRQTPTVLHSTDENWDFVSKFDTRDQNIIAINKRGGDGKTDVHILNRETPTQPYQQFLRQTPTVLHSTDENWDFVGADWDERDGRIDIIAINKHGSNGKTDIHILDGGSPEQPYQRYLRQAPSDLSHTDRNWDFINTDYDYNRDGQSEILAINKNGASGKTEVSVISGYAPPP